MAENHASTPNPPAAQETSQQQGQLQQALASNHAPSVNSAGENLQCQWQGCGERCPSAEALYVSLPLHQAMQACLRIK